MPTNDRNVGSRPRRRRRQGLAVALLLVAVPACTNLEGSGNSTGNFSAMFQSNPYEQSTIDKWWHGDRTKADVTLPGKENPARTAADDKATRDLEEAKALYQAQEYAKAEPKFTTIAK